MIGDSLEGDTALKAFNQQILNGDHVTPRQRSLDGGGALVDGLSARIRERGDHFIQRVFRASYRWRNDQLMHQQSTGVMRMLDGVPGAHAEQVLMSVESLSQMAYAVI